MKYQIPTRAILVLVAFGANWPGPTHSQSAAGPSDRGNTQFESYQIAQQTYAGVIAQLQNSGYRIDEVKSTFLGRIRIIAHNRVHVREVIVSRSTGEVKRDVVLEVMAGNSGGGQAGNFSGSGSSGNTPGSGASGGGTSSSSSGGGAATGSGGTGAGASVDAGNVGADVSVGSGGVSAGVSVGSGGVGVSVGGGFGGGLGGGLGLGK